MILLSRYFREELCSRGRGGGVCPGKAHGIQLGSPVPRSGYPQSWRRSRATSAVATSLVNRGEVSFPELEKRKSLTFKEFSESSISISHYEKATSVFMALS